MLGWHACPVRQRSDLHVHTHSVAHTCENFFLQVHEPASLDLGKLEKYDHRQETPQSQGNTRYVNCTGASFSALIAFHAAATLSMPSKLKNPHLSSSSSISA